MKSMGVPDQLVADLTAYAAALKTAGLRVMPELSERVIVNAEHGYAGRWDRVVADRAGQLYILDLKTGKDVVEYGSLEIGTQQALYANGTHMATPDFKSYEPMPPVDRMKALILHLPIGAGQGQVYGLDIHKGWRAAGVAFETRRLRTEARNGWMWAYSPATGADAVELRIGRSVALDELGAAVADAKRIGAWTPELEAYALARYDLIRASTAQRTDDLAALWAELHPAGRWTDEVNAMAVRRAEEIRTNQPS